MLHKLSQEQAAAEIETWLLAPNKNYRDTLPWLASLGPKDYEVYLDFVATSAELPKDKLDKEVVHWRRLLNGELAPNSVNTYPVQQASPWALPVPVANPYALQPYRCPYCGSPRPPVHSSHVSSLGWIVFTLLLVTTCVLAPLGLLIRERHSSCPSCRAPLRLR
ncbi:MAG: hypothetical protein RBU37_17340 [Myxococcota bacterium]|jgi:hypothetical protein|nr:hypothetical protein [Myxococcota bacterium]